MQPEQPGQNAAPAPDPQTSPTRPNIPEYLHLDPVVIESPKSKKKPIVIVAIVLILVIAVGATVLWFMWQQNQTKQRLYGALDKLLQTQIVTRKQTVTPSGSSPVLTVDASTDFSNPATPKSSINYHFFPAPKSAVHTSPKFEAAGDIVVLNNKNFYGRLTTAPADILPKNAKLDSWYLISDPLATTLTNTANDFDFLKLRNEFNEVYGIVPFGNLTDNDRSQLDTYIQSNHIYNVIGSRDDTVDGKQVTVYTLKVDYGKLADLNQKIGDLLGIESSKQIMTDNGKPLAVWVDKTSDRIVKLTETIGDAIHQNIATVEESFAYPSNKSIVEPIDATPLL